MTVSLVCIGMFLSVFMGEHAVTVETHSMYLQAMQWALGCFAVVSGAGVVLSLRAPMPQRADEPAESCGE
jgi:membrane protein implicated in regulation of membrane protease activity